MNGEAGHRVQMRWRDLDGLGHVNHTVVLTYLEEGRDAFLKRHGIRRDEYVVGRCSWDFHNEIDPAFESVIVECAVHELGRSSVTTSERILDQRRPGWWSTRSSRWCSGPRAAGLQTDHRGRSARPWRGKGGSPNGVIGTRPGLPPSLSTGPTSSATTTKSVHHRGDRRVEHRGERRRGHRGAPARARGRRHAQWAPGAVRGRDRPDPGRIRPADHGLDRRSQRHDIEERATGLEAKPDISGVESGSMNFGDETFITPPPAGRGIIQRATEGKV